jgi:periplasmic divalent cation tolerance protein
MNYRNEFTMKRLFIYITTSGAEEAMEIGRKLVEEKLAACANIIRGMETVYRWKGEVVSDSETVLILKTTDARYAELEARVKKLHSYEVPCIIAMPVELGSTEYLDWIADETGGGTAR